MIKGLRNNKAFTIIEMLVVIAILSILVLLAAPRFIGKTEDATRARIVNDIRVTETKVQEYLIEEENLEDWGSDVDMSYLNDLIKDRELYSKRGLVEDLIEEGDFSAVPKDFIKTEVRSSLGGEFYSDENGNVHYHHDKKLGANESEDGSTPEDGSSPEDGDTPEACNALEDYKLATDDDFYEDEYERWRYKGDDDYVIIPHKIGGNPVTSYQNMFSSTYVKGVCSDNKNVTNMSWMFAEHQAETLDLSNLDTSGVLSMGGMFSDSQATEIDLSNFDTSKVTSMSSMFSGARADTLDLSSFDTSNVTDMSWMFNDAQADTLDLSKFDTSNVTDMSRMFNGAQADTLDLSKFDTSNVIGMRSMFSDTQAGTLDLSNFNTSSVQSMYAMFTGAQADTLDLSKFDTSNVTDMSWMFSEIQINTLDLSSFDTSQEPTMEGMFAYAQVTEGLAKTVDDAARFNNSEETEIFGFTFEVKQ